MAETKIASQSVDIAWKFTLSSQGFITRYGVLGGQFYKQVLPGGIPVPNLYPAKPITQRQYELASRELARISKAK
jgi:hypothetical protein